MQEALFCQALGLTAPWAVERVALDVERSRIDLYVVWQARSAPCPACGAIDQKLLDACWYGSWRAHAALPGHGSATSANLRLSSLA